jgi:hypothetical protein
MLKDHQKLIPAWTTKYLRLKDNDPLNTDTIMIPVR